jgi:hypothetical protein
MSTRTSQDNSCESAWLCALGSHPLRVQFKPFIASSSTRAHGPDQAKPILDKRCCAQGSGEPDTDRDRSPGWQRQVTTTLVI